MSEQKSSPPIAKLGLILAALCGLGILLSAYGYRMEMWNHKMVFKAITWAAYGGIGAGVVSIIGFVMARNAKSDVGLAVIGFVISAIVVFAPYSYGKLLDRKLHPKIHDISTDTANPPTFVTIVKIRKAAKKKILSVLKTKQSTPLKKLQIFNASTIPTLKQSNSSNRQIRSLTSPSSWSKKWAGSLRPRCLVKDASKPPQRHFGWALRTMSSSASNKRAMRHIWICVRPRGSVKATGAKMPAESRLS